MTLISFIKQGEDLLFGLFVQNFFDSKDIIQLKNRRKTAENISLSSARLSFMHTLSTPG